MNALVCPGHSRPVVQVNYSQPTPDGVFLVSACLDSKPMLRRGDTGDWIGTFEGHKGAVWTTALDYNALRAATGSADWSAKLWDALTGEELHTFKAGHIVKSVNFSKDGTQLLTGGQEKKLRLFNLDKPEADPTFFEGHTGIVKSAILLPNKEGMALSGAADGTVRLWDTRTPGGASVAPIEVGGAVSNMRLSHDGNTVAITAGDNIVAFWDNETATIKKTLTLPGLKEISSISLHPDGSRFIVGDITPWIHIYNYESGEEIDTLKGHHGRVWDVAYHPDGTCFATGADDATVRIWQAASKPAEAGAAA